MEDYLEYKTFRIQEKITEEKINILMSKSKSIIGINTFKCTGQIVSFIFNPYEISEKEIIEWLSIFGLTIKKTNNKSLKSRLLKMAGDNRKNFGGKRLDCCDMNN